jgi:hypothetical protein
MLIELSAEAKSPVIISDSDYMRIGYRPGLGVEPEQISAYHISFFQNKSGIPEFIYQHGMVQVKGSVTAPEFLDVSDYLVEIIFGTV